MGAALRARLSRPPSTRDPRRGCLRQGRAGARRRGINRWSVPDGRDENREEPDDHQHRRRPRSPRRCLHDVARQPHAPAVRGPARRSPARSARAAPAGADGLRRAGRPRPPHLRGAGGRNRDDRHLDLRAARPDLLFTHRLPAVAVADRVARAAAAAAARPRQLPPRAGGDPPPALQAR